MLHRLEDGKVLRGRYQIEGIVGKGGMGNVYKASDLRLPGRMCAIKEVQPEASATPEMRKQEQTQFLREASLLAQLDHPNLPKVSDFFTEGGRDYLVMDFVAGKNLKELNDESRLDGKLLDVDMVMEWAAQILDAVAYLHRQKPSVLHRDIKPANIKLTPDNRIKLVDFGLAKILVADDSSTITVIQGRGTAFYTPLEQYGAESEHTDERSDIYALGATFYHLLSGQSPPEAKSRFLNPAVFKPLHTLNNRVNRKISEAVHWSMEMHPDDRPTSVELLKQALFGGIQRSANKEQIKLTDDWGEALRSNIMLILISTGLFLLAIALTFFQ